MVGERHEAVPKTLAPEYGAWGGGALAVVMMYRGAMDQEHKDCRRERPHHRRVLGHSGRRRILH